MLSSAELETLVAFYNSFELSQVVQSRYGLSDNGACGFSGLTPCAQAEAAIISASLPLLSSSWSSSEPPIGLPSMKI